MLTHAATHCDLDFIEEADLVLGPGGDSTSVLSFLELSKYRIGTLIKQSSVPTHPNSY